MIYDDDDLDEPGLPPDLPRPDHQYVQPDDGAGGAALIKRAADGGGVPLAVAGKENGPKNAAGSPMKGKKGVVRGEDGKIDPVAAYEAAGGKVRPQFPGPDDDGDGAGADVKASWGRDPKDPCPVRPLGHMNGTFYFVDVAHQVRALDERSLGPGTMQSLFGGYMGKGSWAKRNFPPNSKRDTWNNLWLCGFMMESCFQMGLFNPERSVRGPGVWPDGKSGLVLNCGDKVLYWPIKGKGYRPEYCELESGVRLGAFLYCAAPSEPPPAPQAASAADASWFLQFVAESWRWDDVLHAPELMVGWIAAASVAGGLPKRTVLGLTGQRGNGKSELLQAAEAVIGPSACIFDKATEPGVRRVLTKPVPALRVPIIDEAEAKEDNRDLQKLIERARYSYDVGAGRTVIGGAEGGDIKVDAMFAFASIEPPPMEPQDLSRRIGLVLHPLNLDADAVAAFAGKMDRARALGPKLRARMFAEWPRFAPTYQAFRDGLLRQAGCDARLADTYAVVLAALTIFISDAPVADVDVARWAVHVKKARTGDAAESTTAERCLGHLMTAEILDKNGKRLRLGEELHKAMYFQDDVALEVCKNYGVSIVQPHKEVHPEIWYAFVANDHGGLNSIFRSTRWHGGAHRAPLLQLGGALDWKQPVRVSGGRPRGVAIPPNYVPRDALVGHTAPPTPTGEDEEVPF